ncbi:DUF4176 domain-containing protein [Rathayibacter iranicus]|uniref:DUF4176 domain-containing protein n=2 Tax=Rathayibacter iranicus TaxID=59737 RepID=A0AAD1ACQ8_9MICO|nr:DUF4176 domain-containing protein [Rathayibacter iranicus]AZZ55986.1 DUF4176 domain-containing protein [Rathayibacter iranicus]MWV32529.1 DUF4176 domain-containing protein [Rathayibacter iranicus NCPPB 2253 = VKM Ac-1602]PPI47065.1 hypothetical protein C5E09_07935 [Rathayibacter iranicus]PPI60004.1 hypothetical protein C5E08_08865 [Rathayibacter iranicus]PPI71600.1 hypothetical protein C5E01_07900 [Rathayibacter iranicus]
MTDLQPDSVHEESRTFLPLGSVVILKGSVKKLVIVSRGSIVKDQFFDYGAFLYPEGMVDTNVAYFNGDDIAKIVYEGYRDTDDELVLAILNNAYIRFQQEHRPPAAVPALAAPARVAADDLFAGVRDLGDDDE